jgi:hypothetical protein
LSDVPAATVVQDGKVGGDVPKPDSDNGRPQRPKRKISNFLLDRQLQLRYILLVTVLSGVISGSLGYMIHLQRAQAVESLERQLSDEPESVRVQTMEKLESENQVAIYRMVGVGVGLVVILSAYLLVMTHKVAGPLFKISTYFERMAHGRLGPVTALRRGDMLQDFYGNFREMHEAVRARAQSDAEAMDKAAAVLREAGGDKLKDALATFDAHVEKRKQQLA